MKPNESTITDDLLKTWDEEFNTLTRQRLADGAKEYGPTAFVNADVFQMAKEELVDLSNYARFLYYKLSALELQITQLEEDVE